MLEIVLTEKNDSISFKNIHFRIDLQKIYEYPEEGNLWYLSAFYVQKSHRGKGNGKKLLSLLTAYANKQQIKIICDVCSYGDLNNEALIKLYSKYGFKERDSIYLKNSIIEDDHCCLIREIDTK